MTSHHKSSASLSRDKEMSKKKNKMNSSNVTKSSIWRGFKLLKKSSDNELNSLREINNNANTRILVKDSKLSNYSNP